MVADIRTPCCAGPDSVSHALRASGVSLPLAGRGEPDSPGPIGSEAASQEQAVSQIVGSEAARHHTPLTQRRAQWCGTGLEKECLTRGVPVVRHLCSAKRGTYERED
jgi:hypothetical protein